MPLQSIAARMTKYQQEDVRKGAMLSIVYLVLSALALKYLGFSAFFDPTAAIPIAAVYFGGFRYVPIIFCAALAAQFFALQPIPATLGFALAAGVQTLLGAFALRFFGIDPVFRNKRDAFILILTCAFCALIHPLASLQISLHPSFPRLYLDAFAPLIIVLPFLLRWFAKPFFRRTALETVETTLAILSVALVDYFFFFDTNLLQRRILAAILLLPFLWVALRLRPRFLTFALLLTSILAFVSGPPSPNPDVLVAAQLYLVGISAVFLVISTQEEERRVSTTIMLSQLRSLENAQATLRSDVDEKKDFVAVLAHELRNPLAPVVSSIELLKLKGARDRDEAEAVEIMADRMSTVQQILANLLDVSRIWTGKIKLNPQPIELHAALQAASLSTDHLRKELHQQLIVEKFPETLWVSGDRVRLEQVFSNLLANASKYSNTGDTISLRVRKDDEFAEIEIVDQGVGISTNQLQTIFQPFRQFHGGDKPVAGLGIGLALVKSFVELHKGEVRAESEGEGLGSRFIVRLPLAKKPGGNIQTEPASIRSRLSSNAPLILIIDDNDTAAAALGRLLQLLQYRVAYCYDGAEAVERALDLSPAVVLLDINLPHVDGITVAKELRERGFGGQIAVLSGYAEHDIKSRYGSDFGVVDRYIMKPASIEDLRTVLPQL